MIILQHEFVASYPGNRKDKIISTLVDYGIPNGSRRPERLDCPRPSAPG